MISSVVGRGLFGLLVLPILEPWVRVMFAIWASPSPIHWRENVGPSEPKNHVM